MSLSELSGRRLPVQSVDFPIETMRGLAVVMLVTYHAIGDQAGSGVGVDYPHPLRIFADIFAFVRMPVFAFISGFVFALKPVSVSSWGGFVGGKVRRLLVPGAVAITAYLVISNLLGFGFGKPWSEAWSAYVFTYAHFWFLQSIFLILCLYALADAATDGRALLPALALAVVLFLSNFSIRPNIFSVYQVGYLAPYFLLGVLMCRQGAIVMLNRKLLLAIAGLGVIVSAGVIGAEYRVTGVVPEWQRTVVGLALGASAILAMALSLPTLRLLSGIGPASFTVYLYHVLGTSSGRRLAILTGIESVWMRVALAAFAGILLPCALYIIARRHNLGRVLIIGERTGTRGRSDGDKTLRVRTVASTR